MERPGPGSKISLCTGWPASLVMGPTLLDDAWLPTRLVLVPVALHPVIHTPLREEQSLDHWDFVAERNRTRRQPQRSPSWVGWTFQCLMRRALLASWHCEVSRRECPWLLSCSVSSCNPSWATCLAKSPSTHSWLPLQAWTQVQEGAGFQEEGAKALWTNQCCCWPIGMGFQTNTLSQPSCLLRTQR